MPSSATSRSSTPLTEPRPLSENPPQPVTLRSFQFTLFLTGALWIAAASRLASSAGQGIANRLNLPLCEDLLQQIFFLFLLLCGFAAIGWIATRSGSIRFNNALPERSTTRQEWLRGIGLGWAMLLAVVLPMAAAGDLHPQLSFAPSAWGLAGLSLTTLLVSTLALEVAFRGFIFRRLIAAIGPVGATILISLIYALVQIKQTDAGPLGMAVSFLMGILLSMAYLRTHALWLGWGLHFAWSAAMRVLLGLPIAGLASYDALVTTSVSGRPWLTGGDYGPQGSIASLLVIALSLIALYALTRDYAWNYTHPPILPAGYAVVVAPPAAHTAMEAAAAPVPLVQILSTTSTSSSTLPVIDEHLRAESALPPTD
jgi:membrane protease YdiL (CAAX protease family)